MRKVERAAIGEIKEAARGSDDDVDTALERIELGLVRHSAIDAEVPGAALGSGNFEVACDLNGQFAGRCHDECLRLAGCGQLVIVGVMGRDCALNDGDAEGKGLAGAGAGLADEVGSHKGNRECHFLNGERALDADVG